MTKKNAVEIRLISADLVRGDFLFVNEFHYWLGGEDLARYIDSFAERSEVAVRLGKATETIFLEHRANPWSVPFIHPVYSYHQSDLEILLQRQSTKEGVFSAASATPFLNHDQWCDGIRIASIRKLVDVPRGFAIVVRPQIDERMTNIAGWLKRDWLKCLPGMQHELSSFLHIEKATPRLF
jgi:hypothetical protein